MAFGIDEIVESALGRWGLVLGLGVSAAIARPEKLMPALAAGAEAGRGRIDALSAAGADRARDGRSRLAALNASGAEKARAGVHKIAPVAAGLRGGVSGLTRSWSEMHDDARAEFEASHPKKVNAVWVNGERVDALIQPRTTAQRDARGRFIKRSDS